MINLRYLSVFVFLLVSLNYGQEDKYEQMEYQIVFRNQNNLPLTGIELKVLSDSTESYCFPILEYSPTFYPVADSNGTFILHHLERGMGYGGKVTDKNPKKYFLHFIHAGQDVAIIDFDELSANARKDIDYRYLNKLPISQVKRNVNPRCSYAVPKVVREYFFLTYKDTIIIHTG